MKKTIYLQIDRNNEVNKRNVKLSDIAKVFCTDKNVASRIKAITIINIADVPKIRITFSVLYVISLINEIYPDAEVNNIGECDFIIDYIKQKKRKPVIEYIQIIIGVVIAFVGSAYGIMAYNNDVSTNEIFEKTYELMGMQNYADFNIIEIAYAVGLTGGIVIFYNHIKRKQFTSDPTPLQIEIDKYEKDTDMALIERASKEKKEYTVK